MYSHQPPYAPTGSGKRIQLAALRVPLALKLIGANIATVTLLLGAYLRLGGTMDSTVAVVYILIVAAHPFIVLVALRPIRDLEVVAARVWQGDFGARVVRSDVADSEVLRVGAMFNLLLDGLVSDRARLRALASEVIAVGDQERAAIARALHDSTAQHVAALQFQLSVAVYESADPALSGRLASARDSAERILEEVRSISHSLRPAMLDDLGLEAALRTLARDTTRTNDVAVDVVAPTTPTRLPRVAEAVLYRVAEESVRNVVRNSSARTMHIRLRREPHFVTLDIRDDGDACLSADPGHARNLAIRSLRERLALVDGWLEISTTTKRGSSLSATVPLEAGLAAGACA